jgi:hypothetical protein
MDTKCAQNLEREFLAALARLSEITKVQRDFPPRIHHLTSDAEIPPGANPAEYRDVIERAKMTIDKYPNIELPPFYIGPNYCSIRAFLDPPTSSSIARHHARAAAGEWLSSQWIDCFDTMHYSVRKNTTEPFDIIDLEDLLSLPDQSIDNGNARKKAYNEQLLKVWDGKAVPAAQLAKGYVRQYCMVLMVRDSEEWIIGSQECEAQPEMTRFETVLELAGDLGSFSAWERGRDEFARLLRIRQNEFHEYLNQVYREAVEKSSRESE